MIDPHRIFTCRYCGDRIKPRRAGRAPSRCRKGDCRKRYERERKRRFRLLKRAGV